MDGVRDSFGIGGCYFRKLFSAVWELLMGQDDMGSWSIGFDITHLVSIAISV